MSAVAVAASSLSAALARYWRSWGLWILLLIAPIGARLFVPRDDGTTIIISVGDRLPLMTSATIGACLGVVVSTLLLPAAYIYLRANTNRRQPWQIADVTPASRVAIALGRYAADLTVLAGALAALNLAGLFLGSLILPAGVNPLELSLALWVIAGPALMGLAALHRLFDALPPLRGALGDLLYFVLWITTLALPSTTTVARPSFAGNMADPGGFVRPLVHGAGLSEPDFTIGGAEVKPGRTPVDTLGGIASPGYLPSRAAWCGIALLVAALSGLVYRPREAPRRRRLAPRLTRWLEPGAPPPADPGSSPARLLARPEAGLLFGEARLIGRGRLFKLLALAVAIGGAFVHDLKLALSAALLPLVFALTAHAGRSEGGLRNLTRLAPLPLWARRLAFVAAAAGWTTALTLPHALVQASPGTAGLAAAFGAAAGALAITIAATSRSAFAPRILLLIAWYAFSAS